MIMQTLYAVLALLAATASAVTSQPQTTPLQPFTSISVCTPFSVLIQPSSGAGIYALVVDADTGVAAAVNASVVDGVLTLSSAGNSPTTISFQAPNPIKVAVQ